MSNKSTDSNLLKKFIFSTNPQKILVHFLCFPNRSFYDREVAKLTKTSRAGTNFSLRSLAEAGLLSREKKGRMYFYALVRHHPLNRQLKIVLTITQMMPLLQELKPSAVRVVLYGSVVSGVDREESDVDLLILTRNRAEVEKKIQVCLFRERLHVVIHTPHEWAIEASTDSVFAEQVNRGMILWESHES